MSIIDFGKDDDTRRKKLVAFQKDLELEKKVEDVTKKTYKIGSKCFSFKLMRQRIARIVDVVVFR